MAGKRFSLISLGCKVNQAEAAHAADRLATMGWTMVEPGQGPTVAVVFTCAVTATASRQSRQAIRRLAKTAAGTIPLACGCGVQAEPEAYREQDCLIVGRADLARLPEIIDQGDWPEQTALARPDGGLFCPGALRPGVGRSRGLLKVQDGCDACCAYCIVPSTRGGPRSLPLAEAQAAFAGLAQAGAKEVVLTGIHLGRWGADLSPRGQLADLIEALLAADAGPRLRLSSLESHEIDQRLIDLAAGQARLCPHFHLPLQSGSDKVLRAMGRPYSADEYAAVALGLAAALPGLCLGADVLVGLPGEDIPAFRQTCDLLESLPISYLHVFPYSPRPGTRAATMADRPAGAEVVSRAAALRRLGQAKRQSFLESRIGQTLDVIVEGGGLGRSADYCLVLMDQSPPPGSLAVVEATGLADTPRGPGLSGRLVGRSSL